MGGIEKFFSQEAPGGIRKEGWVALAALAAVVLQPHKYVEQAWDKLTAEDPTVQLEAKQKMAEVQIAFGVNEQGAFELMKLQEQYAGALELTQGDPDAKSSLDKSFNEKTGAVQLKFKQAK